MLSWWKNLFKEKTETAESKPGFGLDVLIKENEELRDLLKKALLGIDLATIPYLIAKFGNPTVNIIVQWQKQVEDRLNVVSLKKSK